MKNPKIEIVNTELKVIYVRFKGTYSEFRKASRKMFNELFDFAKKNDLIIEDKTKILTIYHDNPFITDSKNLKTSIAMTVSPNVNIIEDDKICTMSFSGKYAILHYDLSLNEYEEAWQYAYQEWLFGSSNEKPRDDFPFELYVTEPPKNFKGKSLTDIYIPIE